MLIRILDRFLLFKYLVNPKHCFYFFVVLLLFTGVIWKKTLIVKKSILIYEKKIPQYEQQLIEVKNKYNEIKNVVNYNKNIYYMFYKHKVIDTVENVYEDIFNSLNRYKEILDIDVKVVLVPVSKKKNSNQKEIDILNNLYYAVKDFYALGYDTGIKGLNIEIWIKHINIEKDEELDDLFIFAEIIKQYLIRVYPVNIESIIYNARGYKYSIKMQFFTI